MAGRTVHAGQLDRRVQVLRAALTDDGLQTRRGAHVPVGQPLWAARYDAGDRERFAAGQTIATVETRFVVRWSLFTVAITPADRLSSEGRVYEIVGTKEVGGRRQWVEISTRGVTM